MCVIDTQAGHDLLREIDPSPEDYERITLLIARVEDEARQADADA